MHNTKKQQQVKWENTAKAINSDTDESLEECITATNSKTACSSFKVLLRKVL